ncbi:MAG TPA: TetR family transcriptional regulator [Caulobacteraceae bacterium]
MTTEQDAETDGRRRRAQDSRARIVAAMLDLTQTGNVSASAELVAERAGVGLRTVFRHFKDMDSLYREMSLIIEARVVGEVDRAFTSADWRGQLEELIHRRATLFEMITPYKRAEAAQRHRSRFLEEDIRRLNCRLREILAEILPAAVVGDGMAFEALDLLLSFESWDRLRREQNLSPEQARAVLGQAAGRLLG